MSVSSETTHATVETAEPASEPLSLADTAWYRLEAPDNPVDITAVITFEGPLELARVRQLVEQRLLRHARFRQRVVDRAPHLARPRWEPDPRFDLDAHLRRATLPAPGDEAALQALAGEAMSAPIDLSRPLWSALVIDGLAGGRSALLSRLHHCMGDGFALARVLLSLADADPAPPDASEHPRAEHPRDDRRSLLDEAHAFAHHPAHARRLAVELARAAGSAAHLLLLSYDRPNALHGRALSGTRRAAWSAQIPLERVKAIGHRAGATVNDVLMAAMAGALRAYLLERGDAASAPIRAFVPVNLRAATSIEQMAPTLGNEFGLVYLELPVHQAAPRARLLALKHSMDVLKHNPEALVASSILKALGRAPAALERAIAPVFGHKASLVVSNVPGPRRPVRFAGQTIQDVVFWVPHPTGLGVGLSVMSYAGRVRVGVRADTALVPDPTRLAALFERELGVLEGDGAAG